MKKLLQVIFLLGLLYNVSYGQTLYYPTQKQLVFDALPSVPKPGYLLPIIDPTFGTTVTRIGDSASFSSDTRWFHSYSKNQPWNSDGNVIKLQPYTHYQMLNGTTFQKTLKVPAVAGPSVWANANPNLMYGTSAKLQTWQPEKNQFYKQDATTGAITIMHTFTEYTQISLGDYEGNLSNDDKYAALQCVKADLSNHLLVYDLVNDVVVATLSIPNAPNSCAMSQSGNYIICQWDQDGSGSFQGITVYNRSDLSFVRNLRASQRHSDCGYDTQGNEVLVSENATGANRALTMIRLDNGTITTLLSDNQMTYSIHVSCRNTGRPGYAYVTEYQSVCCTQTDKPNYQKIFAVKLDPSATGNALTETYAHVHHSNISDYERSPFGVPNRDGSKVMFRSDWDIPYGEIDSYIAYKATNTDQLPPSAPTGLLASAITSSSFTLEWTASTDNEGVTGYNVYKNGVFYDSTTTATNLSITGLSASTTYAMTVKAKDAAGNTTSSTVLSVTTYPTGSSSVNLLVNPGFESGTTGWTAWNIPTVVANNQQSGSNSCQLAVSGNAAQTVSSGFIIGREYTYSIWVKYAGAGTGGGSINLQCFNGTSQVLIKSSAISSTIGTTYKRYLVTAPILATTTEIRVSFENYSNQVMYVDDADLIDNSLVPQADVTPPTAPTALSSSAIITSSFTLSWIASTDNVGVTGYDVLKDGVLYGSTTTATSLSITGLSANTSYSMTVKAKDAAGNSRTSAALSVPTSPANLAINLLVNPGFESGTTGWTAWNTPTIVSSNQRSGTKSCQVAVSIGKAAQTVTSGFTVGSTYTYSIWVKYAAAGGTGGGNINFQCFDRRSKQLSINSTAVLSSIGITYNQYSVTVTIPANTTQIRVSFENSSNQVMYVDDAALILGTSPMSRLAPSIAPPKIAPVNTVSVEFIPNPFVDRALIRINSPANEMLTVSVRDMAGRLIFTRRLNGGQHNIPITRMGAGSVYILSVTDSKQKVFTKNIIQQ